ncbi:MAG: hypothetical protein JNM90_18790 [Burkholderiales bacterium]|nr:hypothetical protein [Burkholderiales bacterium]
MLEPVLDLRLLRPGARFANVACVLDDAFVDAYLDATGEAHPAYARAQVPPLALSLVRFTKQALGGRWPSGTLQLGQTFRSLRAPRRGERLDLDLRVGAVEERDGRLRFELLSAARDAGGALVAEQRMTQLWAGAGARSGARPPAPAAAGAEQPAAAAPIGPLADRYPMARLQALGAGAGARDPTHLDPAFARPTPLGVNIVQGKLVMTLIWRLLLAHLGPRWNDGGALDIRFRRPLPVDTPVAAWAQADASAGGTTYAVWCSDAAGERVIVGSAEAPAP